MEQWIRSATLQVGPYRYSLDGIDFSFTVTFQDSEELASANVEIKNLSENTCRSLQRGHVVIINAGYESNIDVIFKGKIESVSSKHEGTDRTTKIQAIEVMDEWLNSQINKTYKKDIMAQDMVDDMLNIFGVEVGKMELVDNKCYPRGRTCAGMTKDLLQEIVMSDCQSRFLIRAGQVYINDPQDGINMGLLLSPGTGLLRCDEDGEITEFETDLTAGSSREEKDANAGLKKRRCLLNPNLGAGDIVMFQSKSLNGRHMVVRGSHIGSQSGDWVTEIEVKPV